MFDIQVSNPTNPPDPAPKLSIINYYSSETYEGFDKVGYVNVYVKNNGDPGYSTVYVTVTQGSNQWTKSESAYIDSYQYELLSFRFPEIEFWTTDPWAYSITT